jgi:hypothetical protein
LANYLSIPTVVVVLFCVVLFVGMDACRVYLLCSFFKKAGAQSTDSVPEWQRVAQEKARKRVEMPDPADGKRNADPPPAAVR